MSGSDDVVLIIAAADSHYVVYVNDVLSGTLHIRGVEWFAISLQGESVRRLNVSEFITDPFSLRLCLLEFFARGEDPLALAVRSEALRMVRTLGSD